MVISRSLSMLIYVKCDHRDPRALWDELRQVKPSNEPWVLEGDFNVTLHAAERHGGAPPTLGSMEEFASMMVDCGLQDAGYVGNVYTWYRNKLWQRLDRILYSSAWANLFNSVRVEHLSRTFSDHSPLLMCYHNFPKRGPLAFRF